MLRAGLSQKPRISTRQPHVEDVVSLFDNSREANITSTIAMVEDALIELGHFVNDCREPTPPPGHQVWRVVRGSAMVRITLGERQGDIRLKAMSVVMTMTDRVDREALFRHLLLLNAHEIYGAAFGVDGDRVLLVAERSTFDLNRSEVFDLLRRVESYADEYDDKLVARFGGVLGTGL